MSLVRYSGILYLFFWTIYALFDSEAEIYNPLLFFLFFIGLFTQLFWLKWIQELAVARFVLPILILLLIQVPSGIFVPSLEIKGIQYIQDEFAFSFNSFHWIGALISFILMTILYLRNTPKTS
jgi:hypothetical protein